MIAELNLPAMTFATRDEWAAWLEEHHATSDELWLKFTWNGSGFASISFFEAIEVALIYGWVDSLADKLDDDYWLLRFTPRPANARWTMVACRAAEALIERGEMRAAGLREVDRAKVDGRWAG
jgi:uncharacterized protein YdeI (YjbR/CyaY-like superfamily)